MRRHSGADATADYFDGHLHEYGRSRIRGVARLLRPRLPVDPRLVDVGCGTGTNLARLAEALGIRDDTAVDVSARSLEQVRERLPGARLVVGSIVDDDAMRPLARSFDVVLLAAVLHHLVGPTRRASRVQASRGIAAALDLLAPGGTLVLLEPVLGPRPAMTALFWIKRAVTRLTPRRVPVLGYWNNLGAPVVAFYGPAEVDAMVEAAGGETVSRRVRRRRLPGISGPLSRPLGRGDGTWLVVRRGGAAVSPP